MYHSYFKGSHYEAGFRWGRLLLDHDNMILKNIPFYITDKRIKYGEACIPVYQKYYPEILEEIRGIADGQKCSLKILQAFLLGMYAIPPQCHCSCFATATANTVLMGRNCDFLPESRRLNMNVIYRLSDSAIDFTGNTTAFVEIEDGINARGLAGGLTSVFPTVRQPGFNAGILLRYLLEKCGTVREAIDAVKMLPVGSSQNFILADANGNIVSMEINSVKKIFTLGKKSQTNYVCATNCFRQSEMEEYNNPEIDNWASESRLYTMMTFFSSADSEQKIVDVHSAKELLSGRYGFLCQYEKKSGKDTVWSVIYDLKNYRIYRAEGNPRRCKFREDRRFFPSDSSV